MYASGAHSLPWGVKSVVSANREKSCVKNGHWRWFDPGGRGEGGGRDPPHSIYPSSSFLFALIRFTLLRRKGYIGSDILRAYVCVCLYFVRISSCVRMYVCITVGSIVYSSYSSWALSARVSRADGAREHIQRERERERERDIDVRLLDVMHCSTEKRSVRTRYILHTVIS